MTFENIKAGDKVTFWQYAGRGLKGPEYKRETSKVIPFLIFDSHVVVACGNCGQVVDEGNFIEKHSKNIDNRKPSW